MVYPNLKAEMSKKQITQAKLADLLGRTTSTISLKLSGQAPISLDEAFAIKSVIHSRLTLDVLFDKGE